MSCIFETLRHVQDFFPRLFPARRSFSYIHTQELHAASFDTLCYIFFSFFFVNRQRIPGFVGNCWDAPVYVCVVFEIGLNNCLTPV